MSPRFAWPQYRRPLDLEIEVLAPALTVKDGDEAETNRRIRLDLHESWSEVHLRFTLTTTEKAPDSITGQVAYVLVSSTRTATRIPVTLHPGYDGFEGDIVLTKAALSGPVQIAGQIIESGGVARVLGASEPWTLVIDASDAPPMPGAPPFKMAWQSFEAADSPTYLQAARHSYSLMDLTGPEPILWLNKDITGLEAVVSASHAKLEKRRLRDVLGAQIARDALLALFREALAQVVIENDEVTLPDNSLLRQTATVIAAELNSVADVEEMFRKLLTDQQQRQQIWMEIDNAVSSLTNLSESVARSVEEVHFAK